MKFGQLLEYNIRNIFLEKAYTKYGWGTILRHFSKKQKLSMDQESKVLYSLFLLYTKLRTVEMYWNLAADHLVLPHRKLFYKTKRGPPALIFCMIFEEKYFSYFILLPEYLENEKSF